jgi:tRNA 2-selenouridine synthase
MAIEKIAVELFLDLSAKAPVIDVRSPGEFAHAHIPGAHSLPLFSDEERKQVGTSYKQQSREDAIKIGLDYFGPKMRDMVEAAEQLTDGLKGSDQKKTILVHCWRGGMRSSAVAWLLDLYGFKVYLLEGGYKAFRGWVLDKFSKDYPFKVIGGYTGSGKTPVLHELKRKGNLIIDLEGIAKHKGSAFGGLDRDPQPSTEMFENTLAFQLYNLTKQYPDKPIWVEDESQRIGDLNMPVILWDTFRVKPVYFLDVPFEARLDHIVKEYGKHTREKLLNGIVRIQKRLGGLETKTAVNCLLENDIRGCFSILLKYYDKQYAKALNNRTALDKMIRRIDCETVDEKANASRIYAALTAENTVL